MPKNDGDDGPPLCQPPPMRCGPYDMRVEMHGGNGGKGLEQIASTLWKGTSRVAGCSAAYIYREEGFDFVSVCAGGAAALKDFATRYFTESGRPKQPLKDMLHSKAKEGGLLHIESLEVRKDLRGNDLGLDFMESIIKCLAGPMKRVTLVMCQFKPADGQCATNLQAHFKRLGFEQVPAAEADSEAAASKYFVLEPFALPKTRLPRGVNPHMKRDSQRKKREVGKAKADARRQMTAPQAPSDNDATKRAQEPSVAVAPAPPNKRTRTDATKAAPAPEPITAFGQNEVLEAVKAFRGMLVQPRVVYALAKAVQIGTTAWEADLPNFVAGQPGGKFWRSDCFPTCTVRRSYVAGVQQLAFLVGMMLRHGVCPSVEIITKAIDPLPANGDKEWQELRSKLRLESLNRHMISHYIASGGEAKHLLGALLTEARSFCATMESASEQDIDYSALPVAAELQGDLDGFARNLLASE